MMLRSKWFPLMAAAVMGVVGPILAQQTQRAETAPAPGMVRLNFPENMELKVLVDYAGQRLGINFIYDEQIGGKRITIKTPQELPADSLLTLVESALRMKGLMLSGTDVPGTMRVEASRQLSTLSTGPTTAPAAGDRSASAVTRTFQLRHARPQRVEQVVAPFLSTPTASATTLAEHGIVIITDFADNMKKLEELVALVDRPGADVSVQFAPVSYQEASVMAQQVTQLLAGKSRVRDGTPAGAAAAATNVTVLPDDRTNRLAVVGPPDAVREALDIIKELDVSLKMETKIYTLATANAEEVDRLAKLMIGDLAAKRFYKGVTDRETNLLIVTATPEIQQQVDTLIRSLDKPVAETQSPVRFYKLENASAAAVLETLRNIEGDSGLQDLSIDGVTASQPAAAPENNLRGPTPDQINTTDQPPRNGIGAVAAAPARPKAVQVGDTRIMADESSNSIIVVARPSMHAIYEKLIHKLDVRRPQVLIEATLVTLDTTDEFKLGVEFSKTIPLNPGKMLNFTNFGLSTPDPTTGELTLKPGIGFNGAVISTDIANIILQALKNDRRVQVQAQPSVLVNDNAVGKLVSQQEEPFVTVNASSQVALNTFGGYSSAGTSITIKPQISEGENLKLDYDITLSSFNGSSTNGLPPARQTNALKSEATIPNGHTIILGGLTREMKDDNVDRMPVLGEIPIIEYAFSNRRNTKKKATLFVFIHAVILRADKFEDLKTLSTDRTRTAGVPGDFPKSEPVGIR